MLPHLLRKHLHLLPLASNSHTQAVPSHRLGTRVTQRSWLIPAPQHLHERRRRATATCTLRKVANARAEHAANGALSVDLRQCIKHGTQKDNGVTLSVCLKKVSGRPCDIQAEIPRARDGKVAHSRLGGDILLSRADDSTSRRRRL